MVFQGPEFFFAPPPLAPPRRHVGELQTYSLKSAILLVIPLHAGGDAGNTLIEPHGCGGAGPLVLPPPRG